MTIRFLNPRFNLIAATIVSVTCLFLGCNSDDNSPEDETDSGTSTASSLDQNRTTSVAVNQGSNIESPATMGIVIPPAQTTPTGICQLFVNYLATGNRNMAEQLLTPVASRVTSNADLQLEPVAGPNATYKLDPPMYATNKKKLCHVLCRITDLVDGEPVETEITWMCRRQKRGWRIAGMLVAMSPDTPLDLLSFENIDDVARIKGSLETEVNQEIREANARDTNDRTRRLN